MRRGQGEIGALIAVIGMFVFLGWWISRVNTLEWMLSERNDLRQQLQRIEQRIAEKKASLAKELER